MSALYSRAALSAIACHCILFLLVLPAEATALRPGDILVSAGAPFGGGALYKVDPVSGDRVMLSGPGLGAGYAFSIPLGLVIAPDNSIYISDYNAVFRVNPETGDRTVVSGYKVGQGKPMDMPVALAIDPQGGLVVGAGGLLFNVNTVTGDRTEITGSIGRGPSFYSAQDVLVNPTGGYFVSSFEGHRLISVTISPIFGSQRQILSDEFHGSGPPFGPLVGMVFDPQGRIIVASWHPGAIGEGVAGIFRVDPVTGDRSILSGAGIGSGPELKLNGPLGLAWLPSGDLLATDWGETLLRIDPLTGDRTVLSGLTRGEGPSFQLAAGIAVVVPEPPTLVVALSAISLCACFGAFATGRPLSNP